MPELHITSTLLAAETRATPAAPAATAAPADANAFAALLAGQLDPAATLAATLVARAEDEQRADAPAQDAQAAQGDATAQLFAALGMPQEMPKEPALAAAASAGARQADAALPIDAKASRGRSETGRERIAPEAALAAAQQPGAAGAEKAGEPLQSLQPFEAILPRDAASQAGPQAGVAPVSAPADAQPTHAARPGAALPGPVGTPQWREALGSSVILLATQKVQSAELRVQPPELGPVQVSIRIEANEASVILSAPHAETRQAIEDALPRLREMLEAGGLSVGNTSVGDPGAFERETQQRAQRAAADSGEAAAAAPLRAPARADQLIDVFA